ncbi:restriction endonuclease subunit S [Nitrosomonas sp. Nm132]|jgi:type I restriction enzyme S subunit|uniref:restriction endonuclease subunit S n=1 Tax=Nitrosomonas sp. Nm132 TaxID=1881053 RepID=UPI000881D1A2|nr:restriction endonuclease subunit S [Nitrosomonas sp. Nm132]SDG99268.1 type I restriction enzyme, S subunit [Nitrosomonas sp. Nm132]
MELKPGYQQTEVGVIPEDWVICPIGDLVEGFRGGAPFKPSDFTDSGVSVLPKGGVIRGGILDIKENDKQFCSPSFAGTHLNNQIDSAYTIVVLRDLVPSGPSIGLMVKIPTSEIYVLAQGVYGFKVNKQVVAGYLIQLSNTSSYRKLMNSIMVGSTQVHITNTSFKLARIPLPPTRTEQTTIANVLSDADALIQSLTRLIAKKRQIKQGAMQTLLNPYENGQLKAGWVVKKLGDIGVFTKGSGVRKDEAQSGSLPCIRYGEIYTRHNDYIKKFHSFISNDIAKTAKQLKKGDLLFAGSGETKEEIGKCVAFLNESVAFAGGDIVILSPISIDSLFLGYYLNTNTINKQKASMGQGDAVVHISATALANIDIAVPEKSKEQTRIAILLSDMDTEIAALEAKLAKYQQIKQGMMQNLLTGRIRLVKPENKTGAVA